MCKKEIDMKLNRITMMGALAALALMMAPGFTAQAAPPADPGASIVSVGPGGTPPAVDPDTSPDVAGTAGDIETPDVEVEDDIAEVETPDVAEVETPDIEAPEVETPEVETPEVETPELGE